MTHRRILFATATLILPILAAAAPAAAQDTGSWNGFYVGANLGADWGDTSTHTTATAGSISPIDLGRINAGSSNSSNKTGFTGGVEAGYNYQMGSWLLGVETDFGAFDVSQRTSRTIQSGLLPPATLTASQRLSTDWIWTLRPRVGYVSGPWLFYGTGGLAMTDVKYSMQYADTLTPSHTAGMSISDTKTGWVAGLGAAYQFMPQWSVKGEWLYADFGHVRGSTTATPTGFVTFDSEGKVKANLLRIGVDYKF